MAYLAYLVRKSWEIRIFEWRMSNFNTKAGAEFESQQKYYIIINRYWFNSGREYQWPSTRLSGKLFKPRRQFFPRRGSAINQQPIAEAPLLFCLD